jgi:hypothetical protein
MDHLASAHVFGISRESVSWLRIRQNPVGDPLTARLQDTINLASLHPRSPSRPFVERNIIGDDLVEKVVWEGQIPIIGDDERVAVRDKLGYCLAAAAPPRRPQSEWRLLVQRAGDLAFTPEIHPLDLLPGDYRWHHSF